MNLEEALKILGKTKKGRWAIDLYRKGKVKLRILKRLAENPKRISFLEDVEDGLKRQDEFIDKRGMVRPLPKVPRKSKLELADAKTAVKRVGITNRAKKSVGGNGGIEVQRRGKTITEKVTKGMPKEHAKEVARHIKTSKGLALGTGAVAIAGGSYKKGKMDEQRLTKKITKDAKKREAYAKARTKSKKYKSKSHMYPPPKTKRPKSKSHMYPPPKRKKRSGV